MSGHFSPFTIITYGSVSKPIVPLFCSHQNSWDLWMFIPIKMVLIGIDPYPYYHHSSNQSPSEVSLSSPISEHTRVPHSSSVAMGTQSLSDFICICLDYPVLVPNLQRTFAAVRSWPTNAPENSASFPSVSTCVTTKQSNDP